MGSCLTKSPDEPVTSRNVPPDPTPHRSFRRPPPVPPRHESPKRQTQMEAVIETLNKINGRHEARPRVSDASDSLGDILPVPKDQIPEDITVLIALYNYDSRADGDLSFHKGDEMTLIDASNGDWWYVQHIRSGESGYVPRNYVAGRQSIQSEEWYAGRIARNRAEVLVQQINLPRGTFLIREREADILEYALTIRDGDYQEGGGGVKHYKIKRDGPDGEFYITQRRRFKTLQELVQYYTKRADGLCCKLTFAAPRIAPTRNELSRETQAMWEIPRDQIQLVKKIGHGHFGDVWFEGDQEA